MPHVPQRTRFSNGKLALAAGLCIAMVGLAPVAHMMFSPASRVSHRLLTCFVLVWLLPEASMQQEQQLIGALLYVRRWMAAKACLFRQTCEAPMSTRVHVMWAQTSPCEQPQHHQQRSATPRHPGTHPQQCVLSYPATLAGAVSPHACAGGVLWLAACGWLGHSIVLCGFVQAAAYP
jgi:hypothetical protein